MSHAVCGPNARRAELMGFGFDRNYSGGNIATNYASAHYQLQTADSVQQDRPVHRQLNLTTGERKIIGFKKDATAADVERSAGSKAVNATLTQQLVLECQIDWVPHILTLISGAVRNHSVLFSAKGCYLDEHLNIQNLEPVLNLVHTFLLPESGYRGCRLRIHRVVRISLALIYDKPLHTVPLHEKHLAAGLGISSAICG